ncbi:MAG: hypothetical protein IPL61_39420 [Myxococcales bacterium]|nr:hypothetical protein [Myxococcales bacterium]
MLSAFVAMGLAACTDSMIEDEFATEDTSEVDETKADIGGTYTYYHVEADARRCASPYCGGYWVSRANRSDTKCADGVYADRCYVAEIRWSLLGMTPDTIDGIVGAIHTSPVLLRGTVVNKSFGADIGRLGEFKPTEAWLGQGPNAPTGPFAIVEETGVRCMAAPCNSFREKKLNSSATAALAELGWDHADVDDDQIGDGITELFVRNIIIAGDRYTVRGAAGSAKARTVTQFYTRARDHKTCYVGGCSGQVCSDRPGVVTTCEYRPEYTCYRTATCEEQVEGECGWTETDELDACLADPPQF